MKNFILAITITVLLLSLWSCKREEEQPIPKLPEGPIIETPAEIPGHEVTGQKVEYQVIVPPEVEKEWAGVVLIIDDRKLNKKREFTVMIGEEFKIPDSDLTVKVGYFLPDFKISGRVITSASNSPNNPSAGVIIYEDNKKIFPVSREWGWLYANFPTIHPFTHERYGLFLKEGIKKDNNPD